MPQAQKSYYFGEKGQILEVSPELAFANSGFLYAQSVFTTARITENTLTFSASHIERLQKGGAWLFKKEFSASYFEDLIRRSYEELCQQANSIEWRMRLTLFKDQSGEVQSVISFSKLLDRAKEIPYAETVKLSFGGDFKKENVKVGDYRMTLFHEQRSGYPLIFCDEKGLIGEGSMANLLFKDDDGNWITPKNNENILFGIGLLQGLEDLDFQERAIQIDDLQDFHGAWFVNALRGPVPILKINDFTFASSSEEQHLVEEMFDRNSLEAGLKL